MILQTLQYVQHYLEILTMPTNFIAMGLIGTFDFSRKVNQYAFTAICIFMNYVLCIPLPNKMAEIVFDTYLKEVYCWFGISYIIMSDNGSEVKNRLFSEVSSQLRVKNIFVIIHTHKQMEELNHPISF